VKLLGWDTSSKSGALVAIEWDESLRQGWQGVRVVCEWQLSVELTHSERLLWAIDETLRSARWTLEEVGAFAVGVGPGSFTGVRVGVTTARTLAHTLEKPLIGISSLAALARPAAAWLALSKEPALVVATTDAAKGELFSLWGAARSVQDCAAMAEGDRPGLWKRGVEEQVLAPAALVRVLRRKLSLEKKMKWLAVGEGRKRYADAWSELPRARELQARVPGVDQVQGRYLGMLAWEAWQAGLGRDALLLHPRYLRAADAEVRLKAGLLKAAPV
jgi:tRNA threonylcarbamoyladenosine biosynthesis protein TsaB